MSTANAELVSQLRTAIAGWTTEVGAAQDDLSRQIDGANAQLRRLLEVLRERNEHAVALAQANEELIHLRKAVQQSGLPAGAVTQYTAGMGHGGNAAAKDLLQTFDRLENAVQSWTNQVGRSQGGLVKQFGVANGQLERLVGLLSNGANGSASPSPVFEKEFERLQHENSVLSSEVYALNVEIESLRRDQEEFASANLAADTERMVKQRGEIDQLEGLLRVREDELAASQRAEAGLAREIEALQKEIARRDDSEQRLQQAVDRQREETEQHVSMLSALTGEIAALRRAFQGEDALDAAGDVSDVITPSLGDAESGDQDQDFERIAALEATIAQLELEREEVGVLKERIDAFQTQIGELELRPASEELEAAQQKIAELSELVEQLNASAEALAIRAPEADALQEENESLKAQIESLESRPTAEELEGARQQAAELAGVVEQFNADSDALASRVSDYDALRDENESLKAQLKSLASRPTAEDLAAAEQQATELLETIEQLSAESAAHAASASELEMLRVEHAELKAQLNSLESRPTPEAFDASQRQVAELQGELDALRAGAAHSAELEALREENAGLSARVAELEMQGPTLDGAESGDAGASVDTEKEGLRTALATMESELAALRRREEETVATARTLLEELESHRNYEAAQDTALSEVRGESARLQEALSLANAQLADLRVALAAAEEQAGGNPSEGGLATDDVAQLEAEKAALQAALDKNEAQLAAFTAERDEEAAASDMKIAALEDELAALYEKAAAADAGSVARADGAEDASRADALEADLAALREQMAALEGDLAAARAQVESLEAAAQAAPAGGEGEPEEVEQLRGLLERQGAELQEYRDSQITAEKWIADLETQLEEAQATYQTLQSAHEALGGKYEAFAEELVAVRSQEGTRGNALREAIAETAAVRRHAGELEAEIAQFNAKLAEKSAALEAASAAHAALEAQAEAQQSELTSELEVLRQSLETVQAELDVARAHELDLAGKAEEFEQAAVEQSEQGAELNEELARAEATLNAQQQALADRDEQIEALRQDIAEIEAQLQALAEREAGSKQQTDELSTALSAMRETDARYKEELEKNRALLEELRAEHGRQQGQVEELNSRGQELENLLNAARADEMSTLATVDELQEELNAVQAKEKAEVEALAEARGLVSAQQEALRHWEAQVSALEVRMEAMETEKERLSQETAKQQEEIRLAMAQVNQAMHERDEVFEALEAEKSKKQRLQAGAAGDGLGAAEAFSAKEERARQQDILVSELTQSDHNRGLGNILVDAGILTPEQLDGALDVQQQDPSQLLGTILIERGYVTDDAIAQAVACQLQKPVVNPQEIHIQKNAIDTLNKDICTWHVCVPLRMTADRMVVAMANPLDESAIAKLRDVSQREITPVVGTPTHIMGAIEDCYGSF